MRHGQDKRDGRPLAVKDHVGHVNKYVYYIWYNFICNIDY